jgi:hypothetical protein
MISNFIGGGQVFMHKVHMFRQVASIAIILSILTGGGVALYMKQERFSKVDWEAATSFVQAKISLSTQPLINKLAVKPKRASVDAYSKGRLWKRNMLASSVVSSNRFRLAYDRSIDFLFEISIYASLVSALMASIIFFIWGGFGRSLRAEKKKEGSGVVLTDKQVARKLKSLKLASDFKIGEMPLVKDMETRHFLVTGCTGSGKTNLIHNLLPQVEQKKQPCIVIDQTGEMIAKYYNKERGDIIFNPFDARSSNWDFWSDCSTTEELERFSKILIGFSRKASGAKGDPFWENSAEVILNSCAEYLKEQKNFSIEELAKMACKDDLGSLKLKLKDTAAARYLGDDSAGKGADKSSVTANSILSVLATNAKPLTYLRDSKNSENLFSLNQHFANIKSGSDSWLFLSTKPSSRALTLPLTACLVELALSKLIVD